MNEKKSIVKDFASTTQISDAASKKGFKVIVLNEVDRLSKKAQHALVPFFFHFHFILLLFLLLLLLKFGTFEINFFCRLIITK